MECMLPSVLPVAPNGDDCDKNSQLKLFIVAYREMPELWNNCSKQYSDKNKKKAGYERLLKIYKNIKEDATIQDVKSKINILRSNFRKQLNKIKNSKRTGSATEDIYEPTSWLFFELQFLNNVEEPDNSRSTNTTQEDEVMSVRNSSPQIQKSTGKRKIVEKSDHKHLLPFVCNYMENDNRCDEDYPIAKVWASKLQKMNPTQRILAEKAINDVLFEAELGTLHRQSVKIECRELSS